METRGFVPVRRPRKKWEERGKRINRVYVLTSFSAKGENYPGKIERSPLNSSECPDIQNRKGKRVMKNLFYALIASGLMISPTAWLLAQDAEGAGDVTVEEVVLAGASNDSGTPAPQAAGTPTDSSNTPGDSAIGPNGSCDGCDSSAAVPAPKFGCGCEPSGVWVRGHWGRCRNWSCWPTPYFSCACACETCPPCAPCSASVPCPPCAPCSACVPCPPCVSCSPCAPVCPPPCSCGCGCDSGCYGHHGHCGHHARKMARRAMKRSWRYSNFAPAYSWMGGCCY